MDKPFNTNDEIQIIIEKSIIQSLSGQSEKYNEFFKDLEEKLNVNQLLDDSNFQNTDLESQRKFLTTLLDSKKKAYSLMNEYFPEEGKNGFNPEYRLIDFDSLMEEWLMKYPGKQVEFQSKDRFNPVEGDPLWIRVLKISKNSVFQISAFSQKLTNRLRKIRKKNTQAITFLAT